MNERAESIRAARIDWRRWLLGAGLAMAGATLLVNFGKLLFTAMISIGYRYELDYGEGIVWQQMRNMLAGHGYEPIGVFPAIVYHYPPIYHLATAALAAMGGLDELVAGRLLSLLSTLAAMLLVGMLSGSALLRDEDRMVRFGVATFAGLGLASAPTIVNWSVLMRVDMLACALQLAGMMLAVRAITRPSLVPLAAIAFVLAVYTKQTSIAGPAAAVVALWFVRPRSALTLAAWCAGLGLAVLAILSFATGTGFLRHVVLYNLNRFEPGRWRLLILFLMPQIVFMAIAAFGVIFALARLWPGQGERFRARIAADPANGALLMVVLYLLGKAAMVPMILKSGASDNYLIEWMTAVAILGGIGIAPVLRVARDGKTWPAAILVLLATIGVQYEATGTPLGNGVHYAAQDQSYNVGAENMIRRSTKPVITDQMVLMIRAGKPVLWEPAIAAELGSGGLYDERAFVAKIDRRDFAFFLTTGDRGDYFYDSRFNASVQDAIARAYPRTYSAGGSVYHLPAR